MLRVRPGLLGQKEADARSFEGARERLSDILGKSSPSPPSTPPKQP